MTRARTAATIATIVLTVFLTGTGVANAGSFHIVTKSVTQQCE
jgi:hypothetical protein